MEIEIRGASAQEVLQLARQLPEDFTTVGLVLMERDLASHRALGAFVEGAMAGFITTHETDSRVVGISWLGVAPDMQGRGIGTRLVRHALMPYEARGFELCVLKAPETEEDEDCIRTRRFYEKLGFQTLYIIKPYPEWGEDAARVMAARLPLRAGA